jgi:hypothetical protein
MELFTDRIPACAIFVSPSHDGFEPCPVSLEIALNLDVLKAPMERSLLTLLSPFVEKFSSHTSVCSSSASSI